MLLKLTLNFLLNPIQLLNTKLKKYICISSHSSKITFYIFYIKCFFILNAIQKFKNYIFKLVCYAVLSLAVSIQLFFFFESFFFYEARLVFNWFVLVLFSYTLFFSLILLFKKSKLSKYTTIISRFWKRTLAIFWALEGFLFIFFMYATLNTSQEVIFYIDQSFFIKNFQNSWKTVLSFFGLIYFSIFIIKLLNLINNHYLASNNLYKPIIFGFFIYFLYIEYAQFFYVISSYGAADWIFDNLSWVLDVDNSKIRTYLHYVNLCVILKFWHFYLIMFYFIFLALNDSPLKDISTSTLNGLTQNIIIYFILSVIMYMYWFKHFFKIVLAEVYNYLYINADWINKFYNIINFLAEFLNN